MNNKEEVAIKEFTRLELHDLSEKARAMAAIPGLNPFWAHAYWALAFAADHLDAMLARTTTPEEDEAEKSSHFNQARNEGGLFLEELERKNHERLKSMFEEE